MHELPRLDGLIEEANQKIEDGVPAHEEHIRFHLSFASLARNRILFTSYNSMMDLLLNNLMALRATLDHSRKGHAGSQADHRGVEKR